MKLLFQYFGIAATVYFASGVNATPIIHPQETYGSLSQWHYTLQNISNVAIHYKTKGNLTAHTPKMPLAAPITTNELPPIPLHVRPDGIIAPGVASPEDMNLIKTAETTTTGHPFDNYPNSLIRREILGGDSIDNSQILDAVDSAGIIKPGKNPKPDEPKTFDKRPEKYLSQDGDEFSAMTSQERESNLTILWTLASQFQGLDADRMDEEHSWYGPGKSMVLQKFGVGVLNATVHDDNHDDVEFLSRLFNTTSQTLVTWYSNHLQIVKSGEYEGLKDPQFQSYEPIDDYNWIRKAHKVLATMTVEEQKEINKLIDTIDKLSIEDLYKLYDTFEVRGNMLLENQMQAAEFFQVAELKFPNVNGTNSLLSIRRPIQIKDWNDESHPRHYSVRPVDALARYWIKATDSNHDDLVTLTAIKLAHQPIEVQRNFVQRARNLSAPAPPPTPQQLKEFYDMLDINWQGKDDDVKKIEAAKMLCVRELVFAEEPKKWNRSKVRQQPAMVNSCLPVEKEKRLRELFLIEKYDSEHQDPMQKRNEQSDPTAKLGDKVNEKVAEVQAKVGAVKEKAKPKTKLEESLLKLEDKLDGQLEKARKKLKEVGEEVKDVGEMVIDDATRTFDKLSGKSSDPIFV